MSGHRSKAPSHASRARHADIARDLRDAIEGGRLPVGAILPKELELCAHYGVSRHTVRIAIADLSERGMVTRRKRVGTVVSADRPTRRFRQTVHSVEDLMHYGADHVRSVRRTGFVVAGQALADDLACPLGTQWFLVSSLRFERVGDTQPMGLTDVYVDPALSEVGKLARASPDRLISGFVEERTGQRIAAIRQDVTAMLIEDRLSRLLAVQAGSAALRIVRHYLDAAGKPVVGSVSIHPAGRFHVSSMLERSDRD